MNIFSGNITLEIGSGHNPEPYSDILCDKHFFNNEERGGHLKTDRPLVIGDAEELPFKSNAVDKTIAKHVVEHLDNPEKCFEELERVSNEGYIETPTEIIEKLNPKEYHKWFVSKIDNVIQLKQKSNNYSSDFGKLIDYLWEKSPAFRKFLFAQEDIFHVRYTWKESIDYRIIPADRKSTLDLTEEEVLKQLISDPNFIRWKALIPKPLWIPLKTIVAKLKLITAPTINLSELIACPICKTNLRKSEGNSYQCEGCNAHFPIKNSIPVLLRKKAY